MALTPLLNEIGRKAAELIDDKFSVNEVCANFSCEQSMYYEIRLFDCHYLNQFIWFVFDRMRLRQLTMMQLNQLSL